MSSKDASRPNIIIIAGGIGAGKSVVSHILSAMGYPVYDCDSHAKLLMDSSQDIKNGIKHRIHASIISEDGSIDRNALSSIVFSEPSKLSELNSIVHSAVRNDIARWVSGLPANTDIAFIETAIPYASGLHASVDGIWEVNAPLPVRIQRVILRNGLSEGQIMDRIKSQESEHHRNGHKLIINDGETPVIPKLISLLTDICKNTRI